MGISVCNVCKPCKPAKNTCSTTKLTQGLQHKNCAGPAAGAGSHLCTKRGYQQSCATAAVPPHPAPGPRWRSCWAGCGLRRWRQQGAGIVDQQLAHSERIEAHQHNKLSNTGWACREAMCRPCQHSPEGGRLGGGSLQPRPAGGLGIQQRHQGASAVGGRLASCALS